MDFLEGRWTTDSFIPSEYILVERNNKCSNMSPLANEEIFVNTVNFVCIVAGSTTWKKKDKSVRQKLFQEIGYGGAQMALGMYGESGSIEN
jgi:hypothetical protein